MALELTSEQIDAWIEKNGLLPANYGQMAVFLRRCEQEEKNRNARLRMALQGPEACSMIFTGRSGLEAAPF